jgi:hypothetical protein
MVALGARTRSMLVVLALVPIGATVASCADVIGLASVDRVSCVIDCADTLEAGLLDATRDGTSIGEGGRADGGTPPREGGTKRDGGPNPGEGGKNFDTGPGGCKSDSDCQVTALDPRCDLNTGVCVPCLPQNDNCPVGQICKVFNTTYECAAGCDTSADCPADGGVPLTCCGNACVDTTSNAANCGMCGQACSTNNVATVGCGAGLCNGTCATGYADCDQNKLTDGCETDIAGTDIANCGGCGTACSAENITTVTCAAGVCNGSCNASYADCDHNEQTNGCEVDTATNTSDCGACGTVCSANHVATVACGGGACNGTCAAGYADCNSNKQSDGCETDIDNNASNCGQCGKVCTGGATCVAGVCQGCLTGGLSPPAACTTGKDATTQSPWVVCQATCSGAWISSNDGPVSNSYYALTICQSLGYATTGDWYGNWGDTCGSTAAASPGTSCTDLGTAVFSTAFTSEPIGETVEWQCMP